MKFQEFKIHTNSCVIFGRYTSPRRAKGVVVLVHGFGEHSGRYLDSVIPILFAADLAILTYDNVGHGRSSGKRGHCRSYEALLDILKNVIEKAEERFPEIPMFLYGHSMGGNLVLNYALRRDVKLKGVIATSPYLRLAFQPPKWKMILGKLMLKMAPSITLPSGLDPKGISRIPEEVEKYKNDPLVHDKVSPMYSFPVINAGEWVIQNANKLSVKTLLLHGTADPIIDCNGTEIFHHNSSNTALKLLEGGYHELHNDLCREEFFTVITKWIKEQLL